MMEFASRAAIDTTSSSFASTCERTRVRVRFQTGRFRLRLYRSRSQRTLTPGQLQQPDHVEHRHQDDERREGAEDGLNGANVVERAGREIGPQHQTVTASRRVRSSIPTRGDSVAINSGVG